MGTGARVLGIVAILAFVYWLYRAIKPPSLVIRSVDNDKKSGSVTFGRTKSDFSIDLIKARDFRLNGGYGWELKIYANVDGSVSFDLYKKGKLAIKDYSKLFTKPQLVTSLVVGEMVKLKLGATITQLYEGSDAFSTGTTTNGNAEYTIIGFEGDTVFIRDTWWPKYKVHRSAIIKNT